MANASWLGNQPSDSPPINHQDGVIIDEGELELAEREISDLKLRLGMNLQSMSNVLDAEKAIRYVKESVDKVKKGVDFYVTGTKVFFVPSLGGKQSIHVHCLFSHCSCSS